MAVKDIEIVEVPAGRGHLQLEAYRIMTDGLAPFGRGWVLFTPAEPDDTEACLDHLCISFTTMHGTLLAWVRKAGVAFILDRVNAPTLATPDLGWTKRVVDIRPLLD